MGQRAAAARKQLPPAFRQSFPRALYQVLEGFHGVSPRELTVRLLWGAHNAFQPPGALPRCDQLEPRSQPWNLARPARPPLTCGRGCGGPGMSAAVVMVVVPAGRNAFVAGDQTWPDSPRARGAAPP